MYVKFVFTKLKNRVWCSQVKNCYRTFYNSYSRDSSPRVKLFVKVAPVGFISAIPFLSYFDNGPTLDTPKNDTLLDDNDKNNGWIRVKKLLWTDDYNGLTPELQMTADTAMLAGLCAFMLGAFSESRRTYLKFILEEQMTKYDNMHLAKRALTDKMFLAILRGGLKPAWRVALFTFALMFTSMAVGTYNGKFTPIDLTAGGALAGCLWKLKDGPKPMMSGTFVGGLLGFIAGVVYHALCIVTGISLQDVMDAGTEDIVHRSKKKDEEINERRRQSPDDLVAIHSILLETPLKADYKTVSDQETVTDQKTVPDGKIVTDKKTVMEPSVGK